MLQQGCDIKATSPSNGISISRNASSHQEAWDQVRRISESVQRLKV